MNGYRRVRRGKDPEAGTRDSSEEDYHHQTHKYKLLQLNPTNMQSHQVSHTSSYNPDATNITGSKMDIPHLRRGENREESSISNSFWS